MSSSLSIDKSFEKRNKKNIERMSKDKILAELTRNWFDVSFKNEYSYHFKWLGVPIIQYPQDVVALQEIIWKVKPDLIIETGVARGGSLIFSASMLELIGNRGEVIGIDIKIRKKNQNSIKNHKLSKRIHLIEGSSITKKVLSKVLHLTKDKKKILVILDSNHTHKHVIKELEIYSPLVTKGSYLVVFDTIIDDMAEGLSKNRPWGKGNNPKSAVQEFLKTNNRFKVDKEIENKLAISVAPNGYLRCVKN